MNSWQDKCDGHKPQPWREDRDHQEDFPQRPSLSMCPLGSSWLTLVHQGNPLLVLGTPSTCSQGGSAIIQHHISCHCPPERSFLS